MTAFARQIDTCLATLGTDDFAPAFCDLVETLGAHQLMVFSISPDRARCLMSRHFSDAALAGKLAETYLDGWFQKDPLLPELMRAMPGAVHQRKIDKNHPNMSAEYREIFFDHPGLVAKTTLLAAGESLRLFVSLYMTGEAETECDPDIAQLAGRLALMHFEKGSDSDFPAPLAALSERERAVCLGILSGHKAEVIAADLGVASSTVVTYRKRAYNKLGITSRAGLFAICNT